MSHSEAIARFVKTVQVGEMPEAVLAMAHGAVLDHVGCIMGGTRTVLADRLVAALDPVPGSGPSTALGLGLKLSPREAAFLGAHCANMLDYDDTYLDLGHPGTTIIPAALAVGEAVRATGAEVLAAIVAGYEVACRLAAATRPSLERFRQIYPVPWQAFGAAVVAARLYGLSEEQIRSTLGICLELASVGTVLTTETTFGFKAGKMGHYAATGVLAASMARAGFLGKQHVLDEQTPFWLAFGSDRCDYDRLSQDLGTEWLLLTLSFKPYPACRLTHSAIDAARMLGGRGEVPLAQVTGGELVTFSRALQLQAPVPEKFEHGPFCLPFVVALGLGNVAPGPDWYTPERLADPEVLRVARSLRLRSDPEFDRRNELGLMPARLTVVKADGSSVTVQVDDAKGDPVHPLTPDDLLTKFLLMAEPVVGGKAVQLAATIQNLISLPDLSELADLATPGR